MRNLSNGGSKIGASQIFGNVEQFAKLSSGPQQDFRPVSSPQLLKFYRNYSANETRNPFFVDFASNSTDQPMILGQ